MHAYIDMKSRTYHRIDCKCVKDIKPKYFVQMRENIADYYNTSIDILSENIFTDNVSSNKSKLQLLIPLL